MTANRLTDEKGSGESAVKQICALQEEVEAYKSQVKVMRAEMEEQVQFLFCYFINLYF